MEEANTYTANNNGGELMAITFDFIEPDLNDIDNSEMVLDIACALSESL